MSKISKKELVNTLSKWLITYGAQEFIKGGMKITIDGVYYLEKGRASIHRISDDLQLDHIEAPYFLGLSTIYNEYFPIYIKITSEQAIIYSIPREKAAGVINRNQLHFITTKLILTNASLLFNHDEIVSARSSYDAIKKILLLYSDRSLEFRKNIASTIGNLTNLSRSTIMNILGDLKKGGYITIKKGYLLSVNKLPSKY